MSEASENLNPLSCGKFTNVKFVWIILVFELDLPVEY